MRSLEKEGKSLVDIRLIKEHLIATERAASHAATHLHMGVYTNTPGMTNWRGANIGRPTTIYDLKNQPLFYDFPVSSPKREPLGLIRTSASRVLGTPAPSIYLGAAPWDVEKASLRARELVEKKYRGKVIGTKIVCYAYPKLGVAVEWTERGREQTRRTIMDISDLSVVPEKVEAGMRGPGAWSLYDRIPDRVVPEVVRHFALHDKAVDELRQRTGKDLSTRLKAGEFQLVQTAMKRIISFFTTKTLSFCTHSYTHECFRMHGQENGVWCTVATGQMILDFWRYNFTQASIATAMGTGTGGTSWPGEEKGLESLTSNHFDAQSDFSATFDKAKAEIDANRPFDYSYSYHSMACAGYRQQNIFLLGTQPVNSVYLYDPWPVNVGTIRWETWGAGISPVEGFLYLRRV